MEFTGLHHITMITGDAQRNARYYGDLLGLRLVKKTVNFDQPQAYHLYFGDETGAPGSILTWFEFPAAAPARARSTRCSSRSPTRRRSTSGSSASGRPSARPASCASPTTTASSS